MGQELIDALLSYFGAVAQERHQLASDLQLGSATREVHAIIRDLAHAVVTALDPSRTPAPATPAEAPPAAAPPAGE